MPGKYLNPRNDVAFRKLFGTVGYENVLISFINAVLGLTEGRRLKTVKALNPYLQSDTYEDKSSIVDVSCIDEAGKRYIVEMQLQSKAGFNHRVVYNASKMFTNQIKLGDEYTQLNPVIFIGILDFNYFENTDYLVRYRLADEKTGEQKLSSLDFYFLQLPRFTKTEAELETDVDKWLYFLRHANEMDAIPPKLSEPVLETAFDMMSRMNLTQVEDLNYFKTNLAIQDKINEMKFAEARGEKNNQIKMARKMFERNMPIDEIVEFTGLSIEDINEIIAS